MSSVKREYSQGASNPMAVTITEGTGASTNYAKVFIDTRISSVFTVDISEMTGTGSDMYVELDTIEGAPGALCGKEITVIFSANSSTDTIYTYFTDNFGPNASVLYVNMYARTLSMPMAMKLISDGTDFVLIDKTNNNNN